MSKATTASVRYVGPHEAVLVVTPSGGYSPPVAQGDVYETTAEHAEQLLEQASNWEPVGSGKASKAARKEEVE